jgi:hypothetical protein
MLMALGAAGPPGTSCAAGTTLVADRTGFLATGFVTLGGLFRAGFPAAPFRLDAALAMVFLPICSSAKTGAGCR